MHTERFETDVLVFGGGIAGLMVAISARKAQGSRTEKVGDGRLNVS